MTDLSNEQIPLNDPELDGEYFNLSPGCIFASAAFMLALIVLAGVGLCTVLGL